MSLNIDDHRRMMGLSTFGSDGRIKEPRIEIRELDEGRITVDIQDMNTGYRYCREFVLSYNHNRGYKNFGQGLIAAVENPLSKGIDKILMLFL